MNARKDNVFKNHNQKHNTIYKCNYSINVRNLLCMEIVTSYSIATFHPQQVEPVNKPETTLQHQLLSPYQTNLDCSVQFSHTALC